jgi:hypothetical protein
MDWIIIFTDMKCLHGLTTNFLKIFIKNDYDKK